MKVIVCEKCFNIPIITITNKNKIQLECKYCNSTISSDIDYFNKYIKVNENDDLFTLPNCNFKSHQEKSILYCFKCSKYICNDCLDNHNEIFEGEDILLLNKRFIINIFVKRKIMKKIY